MKRLNIHKTLVLMAALDVMLALLIISITVYVYAFRYDQSSEAELYALPVISLLSLVGAIVTILLLHPMYSHNVRLKQTEASLDDLNKLNNELRSQRHDFMNHLQVVHSLIELDEHTEANSYIEKVYSNIEKVSSVLKTGIPAVNAILEAKRLACVNKGIEVTVDIRTTLSGIQIPDWELCRVLGNIIDNSMNALSETSADPRLNVEMFEDLHSYRLKIKNNGPAIPPGLWGRIFEAGFTTRLRDGEGMGLKICSDILGKYGGKLWVLSDEYETVFEGFAPKAMSSADDNGLIGLRA